MGRDDQSLLDDQSESGGKDTAPGDADGGVKGEAES